MGAESFHTIYMYTHIHIYIYIYIHTYIHTHAYTHTQVGAESSHQEPLVNKLEYWNKYIIVKFSVNNPTH